nr:DUF1799 domain-containing protein [Methylomonas sp. ZR1]
MPAGFAQPETCFKVEAENWESVMVFLSLDTQWQIGAMGEVIGLNYAGVESVFRIKRIKNREALFDDLQIMERAAVTAFREQRQKK